MCGSPRAWRSHPVRLISDCPAFSPTARVCRRQSEASPCGRGGCRAALGSGGRDGSDPPDPSLHPGACRGARGAASAPARNPAASPASSGALPPDPAGGLPAPGPPGRIGDQPRSPLTDRRKGNHTGQPGRKTPQRGPVLPPGNPARLVKDRSVRGSPARLWWLNQPPHGHLPRQWLIDERGGHPQSEHPPQGRSSTYSCRAAVSRSTHSIRSPRR